MVQLLLTNGADPSILTMDGQSALDLAQNNEIRNLIMEYQRPIKWAFDE
jgi:hypothetical protein